jgi:amino acid transporter
VAFAIGLDKYFPPAFGRVHPKWKTPYVAILVQASLATIFLLISVLGKGTTVEKAYLILLDTQLLIYFIPYCYLFISFLLHRRTEVPPETVRVPGGSAGAWAVGLSGLLVTLFAMIVAMTTVVPARKAQPVVAKIATEEFAFAPLSTQPVHPLL